MPYPYCRYRCHIWQPAFSKQCKISIFCSKLTSKNKVEYTTDFFGIHECLPFSHFSLMASIQCPISTSLFALCDEQFRSEEPPRKSVGLPSLHVRIFRVWVYTCFSFVSPAILSRCCPKPCMANADFFFVNRTL